MFSNKFMILMGGHWKVFIMTQMGMAILMMLINIVTKIQIPDFYFGISSNLTYKNFDWSFTFRGSLGNYMYNNVSSSNGYKNSMFIGAGNYITNASTSLLQTNFVNAQFFSDYYIENASFLKLDNMTFGYNFDP